MVYAPRTSIHLANGCRSETALPSKRRLFRSNRDHSRTFVIHKQFRLGGCATRTFERIDLRLQPLHQLLELAHALAQGWGTRRRFLGGGRFLHRLDESGEQMSV